MKTSSILINENGIVMALDASRGKVKSPRMTTTYIRINSEGIVTGTVERRPEFQRANCPSFKGPDKPCTNSPDCSCTVEYYHYDQALTRFNASYREFEDQEKAWWKICMAGLVKSYHSSPKKVMGDARKQLSGTELALEVEVEEIGQVKLTDGAWRDTEGEYGFSAFEIRDSRTVYRIVD